MHCLLNRLVTGLLIFASSNLFAFTVNPELPRQPVIENVSVIVETERLSYQQIVAVIPIRAIGIRSGCITRKPENCRGFWKYPIHCWTTLSSM